MKSKAKIGHAAARTLALCAVVLGAECIGEAGTASRSHAAGSEAIEERRVHARPGSDIGFTSAPGAHAVEGLRRNFTVPTPHGRWRGLHEFGRDLFEVPGGQFAPVENAPVGPDYVLGPGDNLVVFVSGFSDTNYSLTLDREGKIFLPRVGSLFLWGLSYADAEKLIRGRLDGVLRNARVQVSMGRLRVLEVLVLGAARHPGKYTLTGQATTFHALSAAGGPAELGSLRDIRVLRGNSEIARFDLYPFLLAGDRAADVRLQAGDVVFVGMARAKVGIQGAVLRPGVYESDGRLTLRQLLDMAGGTTPFADLARIRIERVEAHGGFRVQDLPLNHGRGVDPDSLILDDFDLVTVLSLHERVRNVVTLDGYVRHPGEYEWTPGMRLSDLVPTQRLLPEASLDHAEMRRVDPATLEVTVRPVSLRAVWSGNDDLALQPLDAVSVFSSARLPRSVRLEGEVVRPGTYTIGSGERLSQVLERAGGVTAHGHLPAAVFTRREAVQQERSLLREYLRRHRLDSAQDQAWLAQEGDSSAVAAAGQAHGELAEALAMQTDPGRVVLDLDPEGRWIGSLRDPVLEDGDRLLVPVKPSMVTILGHVMSPGTVLARKGASFGDYIRIAGGPARSADLGRSYVVRASGEALPKSGVSRIEPGDAILVPAREKPRSSIGGFFSNHLRVLAEVVTAVALVVVATR